MNNVKEPFIIGITGPFGSGKSTAADFFMSCGFKKIVLSSFLEDEAEKRNLPSTRKILQDIGNELRSIHGKSILAVKALEQIKKENIEKIIIDGIRNIGEIEELRRHSNLLVIGIVVDRKTRFERLSENGRREVLTWDLFTKLDYRDLGIGESESGLQVGICLAVADIFIDNNSTKKEFTEKLKKCLANVQK